MKNTINRYALLIASSSILAASAASAANTFYAPGDLVLFFQQEGGTNTVYANLGNTATAFRGTAAGAADGVNQINFLDLNTTLTSAFGAGWASDSTVYAGLGGVWGTNTTSAVLQNGDPHRTIYTSSSRDTLGTLGVANSTGWDMTLAGNSAMSSGSSGITAMNNAFENNYDAIQTVSITSISTIDEQNPTASAIQSPAFQAAFAGGVQQVGTAGNRGDYGGSVGTAEFSLDLYRILARNNVSGQVAGDLRVGSFEGTVVVNNSGQVSFLAVPEPSSLALSGLAIGAFVFRRRRSA